MKTIFVACYQEDKYGETELLCAFSTRKKAVEYIENMKSIPEIDSEGYSNDDYFPSEFITIEELDLLD